MYQTSVETKIIESDPERRCTIEMPHHFNVTRTNRYEDKQSCLRLAISNNEEESKYEKKRSVVF